jgi:nucleotide-binding universal stress UspA family protein
MRAAFQHIIVATDFGDSSRRAVDIAVDLATRFAARLTVVHVIEDVVPPYPTDGIAAIPVSVFEDLERSAQSELDRVLLSMKDRAPLVEGVLRKGQPAAEILAHAEETACDLVVVGTHGRRGPARWLLGSVAEKLVRAAPAPVLTVRGDDMRASVTRQMRNAG